MKPERVTTMGNLWKTGGLAVCLCLGLTGLASGAQGDQEAKITELIQQLTKGNRLTRATAAIVIAQYGPQAARAMPALLEALNDERAYLRLQAAIAICHIRADPEKAVPALIARLNDEGDIPEEVSAKVCHAAANALCAYGPAAKEAVPALLRKVYSRDVTMRALSINALAGIRSEPKTVIPVLVSILNEKDPGYMRAVAASALGCYGAEAKEAIPHLLSAFPCEDIQEERRKRVIQSNFVTAFGNLGSAAEPLLPRLVALFGDQNEHRDLRRAALRALGNLGPVAKRTVPALQEFRTNRDYLPDLQEIDHVLSKIQGNLKGS